MLAAKFGAIFPHLDERQRRLLMGAEARALGHGGIRLVAAGGAGVREGDGVAGRPGAGVRGGAAGPGAAAGRGPQAAAADRPGAGPGAAGAGRSREERGDPMSPLRWTAKSTRTLAGELTAARAIRCRRGHGARAAARAGVQPAGQRQDHRGAASTRTGTPSSGTSTSRPRAHLDAGDPVISVDTKKKELVGEYENGGRTWRPAGDPVRVRDHDFPGPDDGQGDPVRDLRPGRRTPAG